MARRKVKKSSTLNFKDQEILNKNDISNRLDKSTVAKYNSGMRRFVKFCDEHSLLLYPSEDNLCHFISVISREVAPDTVGKYLTGISFSMRKDFPMITQIRMSDRVKDSLKGCQKSFSKPIAQANAFTFHDLKLSASFYHSTFDDKLFNTILALGFSGLHRLGELTIPDSKSLQNDRKSIRRASLVISICGSVACYNLPYHKGDLTFKGTPVAIVSRQNNDTCPIETIVKYTLDRDKKFPINPFWLIKEDGRQPSRSWFMNRLQKIFGSTRSGHSLRAGGATAYAQNGMDMDTIQSIGRWSSEAFRSYIRTHPLLNLSKTQRCNQASGFTTEEHVRFPGAVLVSIYSMQNIVDRTRSLLRSQKAIAD